VATNVGCGVGFGVAVGIGVVVGLAGSVWTADEIHDSWALGLAPKLVHPVNPTTMPTSPRRKDGGSGQRALAPAGLVTIRELLLFLIPITRLHNSVGTDAPPSDSETTQLWRRL
jgi:hypothetical protein